MRGQIQVLVSSVALGLVVATVAVLFTGIYAYTSSYRVTVRGVSVYDVIMGKPYWTACSLADALLTKLNALRVYVNITEYSLTGGLSTVRSESCTAEIVSRTGTGFHANYTYTVGTVYGTVVKYGVGVEY